MNKNLQTILHYHQMTKHSQQKYAKSLGYMDWATQPNPFREYKGTKKILLPLSSNNPTPPYSLLDEELPSAPLLKESLAQFLEFSMGIAAWKESGGSSWAVRCNASSGNLHPTECYLVLPPMLQEQNNKCSVAHYAPKEHQLELLSTFESDFFQELPKGSFLVGLSSISWREVWKYGERAFRYVNLDVGHAWQSLVVSAKMLGWKLTQLDNISNADLQKIMGLDQRSRFQEEELADILLLLSPISVKNTPSLERILRDIPLLFQGEANQLSHTMHEWEIITEIEQATATDATPQKHVTTSHLQRIASRVSKDVVLQRRSVHVMDKKESQITKEELFTLLRSVKESLDSKRNSLHLLIFIHRVENMEPGLYILVRNEEMQESLQEAMSPNFLWREEEFSSLYLLHEYDYRLISKTISCSQDIASDGAFSLGMLSEFTEQLQNYGSHRYKELFWEAGTIGQQLYLEATSLGLSGTGIGCFLDDMTHQLLGLKNNSFQILYHFTVGRGYVDSRIQTKPAYKREDISH